MAYTMACADAGMSCPASFTTETIDELFEHAMLHGQKNHLEVVANPNAGATKEQLVCVS